MSAIPSSSSGSGPSGPSASSAGPSSAGGKPDRLYVGNLAPSVDEYTLIQIFQKYGRITKLDFMFHKTGVQKGKPRGYAFVEFSNKDDALSAMVKLHDRLLRGRKLVVTYASSAPPSDLPLVPKGRRNSEAPKTTTLSLLKSRQRPTTAAAQIAAMEAKLLSMQKRKPEDEDYIPGQTVRLGSGSASPAPPAVDGVPEGDAEEGDLDEAFIGSAEAEEAAEELEREMMAELAGDGGLDGSASSGRETNRDRKRRKVASPAPAPTSAPHSHPLGSGVGSLPPRPGGPLPPIPNSTSTIEKSAPSLPTSTSATASTPKPPISALQRGLASLPPKPSF